MRSIIAACVILQAIVSTTYSADIVKKYPTWGVSFAPPSDGWNPNMSDYPKRMATWISPNQRDVQHPAWIAVEGVRVTQGPLDDTVQNWMRRFRATTRETTLDGERAVELTILVDDPVNGPEIVIVSLHGNILYCIWGQANHTRTTKREIETIRASWKWIDREPVADHLELDRPVPIPETQLTIALPELAFEMSPANAHIKLDFEVQNVMENQPDFVGIVQLAPKDESAAIQAIADKFLVDIANKTEVKPSPKWKTLHGPILKLITQPFDMVLPAGKQADGSDRPATHVNVMWSIVGVDDQHFLLINYRLAARTPAENERLATLAEKIVESIAPAEKK